MPTLARARWVSSRGEQLAGQRVGIAGEHLDGAAMADKIAAAQCRLVRYDDVPYADFDAGRAPAAGPPNSQ